jgi:NADH-quinone oxidoreductase subunit J
MVETIFFWLFAIGTVFTALQLILQRNPVHSAISLVACFFFLAGLYVLLAAHLIGILQVMVYAGAVMVLFVFVIMLLNLRDEELGGNRVTAWKLIGLLSATVTVGVLVVRAIKPLYAGPLTDLAGKMAGGYEFGSVKAVGRAIYVGSVLPFEVTSLLLLVAVVGAVVVAKGKI